MRILSCLGALTLCALLSHTCANASLVTESFSGTGSLITPGNTGDHTGNTFTVVTNDTSGCAQISFDVSIITGTGVIHFDTRGFGDSSGTNDSFQTTPVSETMQFVISAPTVSVSAGAPAGSTIVSSTVTAGFSSFDLVNNGASPPSVDWTDNLGGSGTGQAAAGTGSGNVTLVNVTSGATTLDLSTAAAWMWINNAQFSYSGDVVVNKPEPVPEPGSLALLTLVGLGFCSSRRR